MENLLKLPEGMSSQKAIAVGVSGGPDSMALLRLLSLWAKPRKIKIHALIVDHGLRKESGKEAKLTAARVKKWPNVVPKILKWKPGKKTTRIQEDARAARYALMAAHCKKHKIARLFLAHHMEDQAETVLMRLAAGSGLDGLAGMRVVQTYNGSLEIIRPLLGVSKVELMAFCKAESIAYAKDPSNEKPQFARVRLRAAAEILEREGLTPKRLSTTARRMNRARETLEALMSKAFREILLENNARRIVLDLKGFNTLLEEIAFRVILKTIRVLRPGEDYLPRMEKIEDLFDDLRGGKNVKRTLGGLVFERKEKDGILIVSREK